MKKKLTFLTLGAALLAVPVLAAPDGPMDHDHGAETLTRAEAQTRAAQMFAKLDANKDGKLDAADRAVRHTEMHAKMFDRLDTDKDGSISRAEWDKHGADRAAKRAERGDKPADATREGKRGMRGQQGRRGDQRGMGSMGGMGGMGDMGGMMMGRADRDGDKTISQAEFQAAALARFDAADANKDGQVTAEERAAQRAAWKAKAAERRAKRGGQPPVPGE